MDTVAKLSARERSDIFQEAAARLGDMTPAIIEKDFWVCWTLGRLFSLEDLSSHLIFKGGTSLSKVFKIIRRFSEDIDLSIDRKLLGFIGERDPSKEMSRSRRDRLLGELNTACEQYISEQLLPKLKSNFSIILGEEKDSKWNIIVDDRDRQTLNFAYPPGITETGGTVPSYIQPAVRLEMGARSEWWPADDYKIQPYSAEVFPKVFENPICQVHALRAERTFWEKATLLHAEYHRPQDKPTGERLSRHYYDLALLAASEFGKRAVENLELLHAVVRHKQLFFRSGWANYESAQTDELHLIPQEQRLPDIRHDYDKTKDLIFGEAPSLEDILDTLKKLESEINTGITLWTTKTSRKGSFQL